MPIFDFECTRCGRVREALVSTSKSAVACDACGSTCSRRQVSRFNVARTRRRTSDSALRARPRDFISDPDRFVTAMDTFGERIGDKLTDDERERAVSNLKNAEP